MAPQSCNVLVMAAKQVQVLHSWHMWLPCIALAYQQCSLAD